jgi:mannose-1-phosphate guanylyltransferase / mannose-6-phosphate isomerase
MYLIILSGGAGSRLWPASRKFFPKPFIKTSNGFSILQNTLHRAVELNPQGIINVSNKEFLFQISKEWDTAPGKSQQTNVDYILEPFGKNTAAAIAMSCLWVKERQALAHDTILLIMPSDHLIKNQKEFKKSVNRAKELASLNRIVTFGVIPNAPEVGYGYIKHDGEKVEKFIEKPSVEKAKEYISTGGYLWNSGIFCFKAQVMLDEMARYCPDILLACQKCFNVSQQNTSTNRLNIDSISFEKVRADSIDYAVMEKTDKMSVIPCDIGWSDIGDWNAFSKMFEADVNANTINAEVVMDNVTNCHFEAGSRKLIAAIGIENLIIIDTPDVLLVANKKNVQGVKDVYNKLAKANHKTHEVHAAVCRPWGSYTVLEEQDNYKIKRIEVNPGASLSLQSHKHRYENWVVVVGQAKVVNNEDECLLKVGQSIYIPAGNKHRLINSSSIDKLIIIETQTGSYLGEDDIVRYDDIYGRIQI